MWLRSLIQDLQLQAGTTREGDGRAEKILHQQQQHQQRAEVNGGREHGVAGVCVEKRRLPLRRHIQLIAAAEALPGPVQGHSLVVPRLEELVADKEAALGLEGPAGPPLLC